MLKFNGQLKLKCKSNKYWQGKALLPFYFLPPNYITFNFISSMKKYPAKLLLFGEHTVNLGSQALAMPLPLFSGHWVFSKKPRPENLLDFADYLASAPLLIKLDVARFKKELAEGLYFKSNIPTGYGIGSSGAVVAAIFDRYCMVREGKDLTLLKKTLAQMESYFHGTSSGTDPLICYLNAAVVLGKNEAKKFELPPIKPPFTFFLLDTYLKRSATTQIEYFLEKNKDPDFNKKLNADYLPAVDAAIDYLTKGEWNLLFDQFHAISTFQFSYLEKLIPADFLEMWQAGMDSNYFKLKICGAGGGGFIFGMTNDSEKLKNDYAGFEILEIEI